MTVRRFILSITATCFLGFGMNAATAGMIGTEQFVAAGARQQQQSRIEAALASEQVRSQLVTMGVDPADAMKRVAALSDAEVEMVAGQLDELPAGGDSFFAVIGVVFVVLLILEITGVTDIFKRI